LTNKVHISQVDERNLFLEDGSNLLAATSSIIGDVFQVSGFTHITGFVYSDVDSALGGLIIEQGLKLTDFPAGTAATENITNSSLTITGSDTINNAFSVQIVAPYARIIYINGGSGQAEFRAIFEARVIRGL
jgi:hypothetical protein